VAGLLGVGFDDLYQREKRRQKRRQMMLAAAAIVVLAGVVATWWSIARIGQSQKQISQKVATVQQQAAVATTQFEKVRPSDNAAKERIEAAQQRAIKAIQVCEQARLNKIPDREYDKLSSAATRAIREVEQTAQTTEESIYAKELSKTALDLFSKEFHAKQAELDAQREALFKQIEKNMKPQMQQTTKP
jgi:DNA phosphorothioation-dependent restriction protein DptG